MWDRRKQRNCGSSDRWQTKRRKLPPKIQIVLLRCVRGIRRQFFFGLRHRPPHTLGHDSMYAYSKFSSIFGGTFLVVLFYLPCTFYCWPIQFSFRTVDSCTVVIRITKKSTLTAMLVERWVPTTARHRHGKSLFSTECGQWRFEIFTRLCAGWEFMQRSCSIAVYHRRGDSGA